MVVGSALDDEFRWAKMGQKWLRFVFFVFYIIQFSTMIFQFSMVCDYQMVSN